MTLNAGKAISSSLVRFGTRVTWTSSSKVKEDIFAGDFGA
jgi:hypothetical protein